MKKIVLIIFYITIIAVIIILLNEVYNYRTYLHYYTQKNISLQEQLREAQKNILVSSKFKDFDVNILELNNLSLKDKFIFIFPEDICNVCYEKVFYNMEEIDKEIKKKIIVFVPSKFKRKFDVYNNIYNLDIDNVISISPKIQLPISITGELIFLYSSPQEEIVAPVFLNSRYYDVKQYIDIIINDNKNKKDIY